MLPRKARPGLRGRRSESTARIGARYARRRAAGPPRASIAGCCCCQCCCCGGGGAGGSSVIIFLWVAHLVHSPPPAYALLIYIPRPMMVSILDVDLGCPSDQENSKSRRDFLQLLSAGAIFAATPIPSKAQESVQEVIFPQSELCAFSLIPLPSNSLPFVSFCIPPMSLL